MCTKIFKKIEGGAVLKGKGQIIEDILRWEMGIVNTYLTYFIEQSLP